MNCLQIPKEWSTPVHIAKSEEKRLEYLFLHHLLESGER